MEIVRKKILLDNFINRQNSNFFTIGETNKREIQMNNNIWGKIPLDIVVSVGDTFNDVCYIGFCLEDYNGEISESSNYDEWDENNYYKYENIGKIFKITDSNTKEVIYKILQYNNVLSFTFNEKGEEFIFASNYDNIKQEDLYKHITILKYQTLMKWYNFLENFRYSLDFYKKCGDRWVSVNEYEYDELFKNIYVEQNEDEKQLIEYYELISDYKELPKEEESINEDESDDEKTIIIGISPYATEFNRTFRLNLKKRYEILLWELSNNVLSGKYDIEKTSNPFIDLSIYIDNDINSIGIYETPQNFWDIKKKYYLGDIVIYEDGTHKLVSGNTLVLMELPSELYKLIEDDNEHWVIKNEFFNGSSSIKATYSDEDLKNDNKRIVVKNSDSGKLYLPTFSYVGEWDEKHWMNMSKEIDKNEEINCEIESRLRSVRRSKKSVDENGNVLPFICSEFDNEGKTNNEIVYCLGISNMYVDNDTKTMHYDIINEVTIEVETNATLTEKYTILGAKKRFYITPFNKYSLEKTITKGRVVNGVNEYNDSTSNESLNRTTISVSDFLFSGDNETQLADITKGKITFKYTIGSEGRFNDNGKISLSGGGVNYEETYDYEITTGCYNYIPNVVIKINNTKWVNIDEKDINEIDISTIRTTDITNITNDDIGKIFRGGSNAENIDSEGNKIDANKFYQLLVPLTYINIDYTSKDISFITNGITVKTLRSNAKYSDINQDNFINENIVKNEYLMGIEDWVDDVDIEIERGISSAFERHNILSEINTMEDLVNYRNNLFKL